ncbi:MULTISPECIES: MarR family winged helix-turn-helix transcriptional regulator [Paenibacillus]|uniref:MarR family winged helix-turn-helix transcriptional regulator n=1 Tax=Paenibacillus TaxID=44249 RepID=UPI0003829B24|nr:MULTISPECIES: MarR family winged helix-turn-helix transcriptional regulator [Paenibacillus]
MKEEIRTTPYTDLFREIGTKLKHTADLKLMELGLNAQQGQILGYIYEHQDKGVIQKDLAEQFNRRGASITSMLQGLEKKGYIRRVIPEHNERQKQLYVMPHVAQLYEEFMEMFLEVERSITQALSEEEAVMLRKILTKLNQNM